MYRLICLLFFMSCNWLYAIAELYVIPLPQSTEFHSGSFDLKNGPVIVETDKVHMKDLEFEIQQVKELFRNTTNTGKEIQPVRLGLFDDNNNFVQICRRYGIDNDPRIGNQGYVLLIDTNTILIAANTSTGLFYGIQTLKQIMQNHTVDFTIPCLKIIDWPQYKYRGMMDDISRGPVPTLDFMKTQIRRCAEWKINLLTCYIEHIVETKSHGDFAPDEASISISQWRELSDYAKQYHIELMGGFQSFSHGENILANPNYKHLAVTYRMYNPLLPETLDFFSDVYSEMIPAFNSGFFAINCDEVWDIGAGATKEAAEKIGVEQIYVDHVLKLDKIVKKFQKRSVVWADIALQYPKILDMLPKDMILGAWEYSPRDSYKEYLEPLYKRGFDIVITPGVLNSNRIMPDLVMARDNIGSFITDGAKYNPLGVLLTVWDDGGMALFSRDWYGVAYSAEKSWNMKGEASVPFVGRFNRVVYGIPNTALSDAIVTLEQLATLPPTQEFNENVLWQKIIPDSGQSVLIRPDYWDRALYICDQTDHLLKMAKACRYTDDIDYFFFTTAQYRYLGQARSRMINAAKEYSLAFQNQLNNKPAARQHLLVALDQVILNSEQLTAIKNEYTRLWLLENKVYWLENVTDKYQNIINGYDDIQKRLKTALQNLDMGITLPAPSNVRLNVIESFGDYFQEWMIAGPFPNENGAMGTDTDYLKSTGGEATTKPVAGKSFTALNDQTFRWSKYHSPEFGVVDVCQKIGKSENAVAYANCRIYSDRDQSVTASFGSDDGVDIFLNGNKVFEKRGQRQFAVDQDTVALPLIKGTNYIILKLFKGPGDWRFSFQILNRNVGHHKYKYTILN